MAPIIVPRRPTDVRTPDPDRVDPIFDEELTSRDVMEIVAAHHSVRYDAAQVDIEQSPEGWTTFRFRYWVDGRSGS